MSTSLVLDGAELRNRRLLAGLTQRALAAKVGVHPISMTRYESGTIRPRPDTVARIAKALGVEISDLASVNG